MISSGLYSIRQKSKHFLRKQHNEEFSMARALKTLFTPLTRTFNTTEKTCHAYTNNFDLNKKNKTRIWNQKNKDWKQKTFKKVGDECRLLKYTPKRTEQELKYKVRRIKNKKANL